MDSEESFDRKRVPRRVKFQPKVPTRKVSKTVAAKKEENDDAESAKANELMQRFQEGMASGRPKVEKKSEPVRVAFGYGAAMGTNAYNGSNLGYQGKCRASTLTAHKEYKEPWNYYSYYPQTLPLRRPYSGNPDLLDEEEFGQDTVFDESMINPAMELGLMEESSEPKLIFLQLPMTIPAMKRVAGAASQASASESKPTSGANPAMKSCGLQDLEAGAMGKMLVYKSGAVKLKLGDTLYDVAPGTKRIFAQDVVAINTKEKTCYSVGEIQNSAVITPDVNSILDNMGID